MHGGFDGVIGYDARDDMPIFFGHFFDEEGGGFLVEEAWHDEGVRLSEEASGENSFGGFAGGGIEEDLGDVNDFGILIIFVFDRDEIADELIGVFDRHVPGGRQPCTGWTADDNHPAMTIEIVLEGLFHFDAHAKIAERFEVGFFGKEMDEHAFAIGDTLGGRFDVPIDAFVVEGAFPGLFGAAIGGIHTPESFEDEQDVVAGDAIERRQVFPDAVHAKPDGDASGGVIEQNAIRSAVEGGGVESDGAREARLLPDGDEDTLGFVATVGGGFEVHSREGVQIAEDRRNLLIGGFRFLGHELDDPRLADIDSLKRHFQRIGVRGNLKCGGAIDQLVVDELFEAHCEILHTFGGADADGIREFFVFSFEDEFADHGGEGHDFAGRNAADTWADGAKEFLGHDPFHVEGHGVSDRDVEFFREEVKDTADGGWGGRGVDSTEDQVPRFCGVDGGHKGFLVAHFTDQDDIWIFADGMFHSDIEIFDIDANFALVDEGFVFGVDEFDRVFQSENMFAVVAVDPVEHGGDGGTFSGAGDAGEEHHSLIVFAEAFHGGREEEAFEVGDMVIDASSHHPDFAELFQHIHAEPPADAIDIDDVGEVGSTFFFEDPAMAFAEHRDEEFDHFLVFDGWSIERFQVTVNADDGRVADFHVEVTGGEFDGGAEDLIDLQFTPGRHQHTGESIKTLLIVISLIVHCHPRSSFDSQNRRFGSRNRQLGAADALQNS